MCTSINEWLAQFFEMRASTLKQGIRALLEMNSPAAAAFKPDDLNFPKLIERLISPGDKLAAALGLDPNNAPGPDDVSHLDGDSKRVIAERLNSLLSLADLATRIDTTNVTADTLAKANKPPSDPTKLAQINYRLLAEAYPEEIGGLLRAFYNHPMIKALAGPGKHPSYVSPETFAAALTDVLAGGALDDVSMEKLIAAIAGLPDYGVKRSLVLIARDAKGDAEAFRKGLEDWYNQSMNRVSGWYKRKTQVVTAIVAAGITLFANADTIHVSRQLFVNPTVRQKIVAAASDKSKQSADSALTAQEKAEVGELTGWSSDFITFNAMKASAAGKPATQPNDAFPGLDLIRSPQLLFSWLMAIVPAHLLGWFLTAVAVSLGAPFWFDTLNRFMNVRSAGVSPDEKNK
jgi:hypothetical protein